MATPFAMIVVPLTNPEAPSTDAVAPAAQKGGLQWLQPLQPPGHFVVGDAADPEGPSRSFGYVESENASVSISMKMRPSDPTHL
jgi:hypothetical protein